MKKLLLIVLALVIAGVFYYSRLPQEQPVASSPPQPVPAPEPEPQVRYPLLPGQSQGQPAPGVGAAAESAPPAPEPLPPLERSDEAVQRVLAQLLGPLAPGMFKSENIVHRAAVTIDNLLQEQVPPKFLVIDPVPGALKVTETDGKLYLSPDNYSRYDAYVRVLEQADAQAAVAQYVRLYPLFQQAFSQLGYPQDYFNDRLVDVIDQLLATPVPAGPVELVRPSVMYKFADPALEALPAGQKMLIRMGPDNAERVKARLRALRAALMARVQQ